LSKLRKVTFSRIAAPSHIIAECVSLFCIIFYIITICSEDKKEGILKGKGNMEIDLTDPASGIVSTATYAAVQSIHDDLSCLDCR
jgi:hypothetical protein